MTTPIINTDMPNVETRDGRPKNPTRAPFTAPTARAKPKLNSRAKNMDAGSSVILVAITTLTRVIAAPMDKSRLPEMITMLWAIVAIKIGVITDKLLYNDMLEKNLGSRTALMANNKMRMLKPG